MVIDPDGIVIVFVDWFRHLNFLFVSCGFFFFFSGWNSIDAYVDHNKMRNSRESSKPPSIPLLARAV